MLIRQVSADEAEAIIKAHHDRAEYHDRALAAAEQAGAPAEILGYHRDWAKAYRADAEELYWDAIDAGLLQRPAWMTD